MATKSTEECTVEQWAEEFRAMFEAFVQMVQRNERGEYPASALPGEWDEWLLMWDGSDE